MRDTSARAQELRRRGIDLLAARRRENAALYNCELRAVCAECEDWADVMRLIDGVLAVTNLAVWTLVGFDADESAFLDELRSIEAAFEDVSDDPQSVSAPPVTTEDGPCVSSDGGISCTGGSAHIPVHPHTEGDV